MLVHFEHVVVLFREAKRTLRLVVVAAGDHSLQDEFKQAPDCLAVALGRLLIV